MARKKNKRSGVDWKEVLNQDGEFLREIVQEVLEVLEAEMDVTGPIFCTNSSESLHHSLGP